MPRQLKRETIVFPDSGILCCDAWGSTRYRFPTRVVSHLAPAPLFTGESHLVNLDRDEPIAAIARLRKHFPVLNPRASLDEVARYIRGERLLIPCVGGYKYFYLGWDLDIWRCKAWNEPLGSVFHLDRIPDQREPCNACMMACYRNASMLMHAAVATTVPASTGPKRSMPQCRKRIRVLIARFVGALFSDSA